MIGKYVSSQYGWLKIYYESEVLKFNLNNTIFGNLSHWHYDIYQVIFDQVYRGKTLLNFRLGYDGKLSYLEIYGGRFDRVQDKE